VSHPPPSPPLPPSFTWPSLRYLTTVKPPQTAEAALVQIAQDIVFNKTLRESQNGGAGRDIISDIERGVSEGAASSGSYTHFGRPDYDKIFQDAVVNHAGEKIGVFYCGPHVVETVLSAKCEEHQDLEGNGPKGQTALRFHAENF
jgi:hypothetical protein